MGNKIKPGDIDENTRLVYWTTNKKKPVYVTPEKYLVLQQKRIEYDQNRYIDNKRSMLKRSNALWHERKVTDPLSHIFYCSRQNALRRKIHFDLTVDEARVIWEKQAGICFYTGIKLILEVVTKSPYQASIDRRDSSKGYTFDNIAFCCHAANLAKRDFAEDLFHSFIADIKNTNSQFKTNPINKSDVLEVLKYMCGYTDFPERKEGQGAYYWRTILREKFEGIGISFTNEDFVKAIHAPVTNPIEVIKNRIKELEPMGNNLVRISELRNILKLIQ